MWRLIYIVLWPLLLIQLALRKVTYWLGSLLGLNRLR